MSDDFKTPFPWELVCIGLGAFLLVSALASCEAAGQASMKAAARAGAGEFYLDTKTGEIDFRYLPAKPQEPKP
jgi:hypothetical protein